MAVVSDYRALLSGYTWTDTVGQAVVLTYSFSTAPTDAITASSAAAAATFQPLSEAEKSVVRAALAQWSAVSGVTFYETTSHVGDITFGFYDLATLGAAGSVGLGTYPSSGNFIDPSGRPETYSNFVTSGGDIQFDANYRVSSKFAADFPHVALHEIGHALGLKHPFDPGAYTLDPSLENGQYTVMDYAQSLRSSTLEPFDVGAIQYLYGTPGSATHPFVERWDSTTQSLTVIGSAGADDLFGSGGNDVFYTSGGADAVSGGEGNDTIYAAGNPVSVNGGPGLDTVVTGLAYTDATTVGGTGSFRYAYIPASNAFQTYYDVERLVFTNGVYSTVTNTLAPDRFNVTDTSTGELDFNAGSVYSGPVAGLSFQYVNLTADGLNVSATLPNSFIHTGAGFDAIDVSAIGGNNVLDGGTNSNFLVGGTGLDTFFVDDRGASTDIWSTISGFHAGDAATIFGVTPAAFTLQWLDGQGAAGYAGLTLHASAPGHATASITLVGYTTADLGNGRLSTSFGVVDDSPYLYVHGNA